MVYTRLDVWYDGTTNQTTKGTIMRKFLARLFWTGTPSTGELLAEALSPEEQERYDRFHNSNALGV